nr:putative membrane protein [Emiliania huxleyi virus 86]
NMRDIGIGAGVLALFIGIGLFASFRKYGVRATITSGPTLIFGSPPPPKEKQATIDSTFGLESGY